MSEKKSPLLAAAAYDAANLRSAKEILRNPERWGGEESGLVQWARAALKRIMEAAVGK